MPSPMKRMTFLARSAAEAGPVAKARAQSPAANLPLMFAKVTPSILLGVLLVVIGYSGVTRR